ncbi:MAG: SMP-30/gluconolactonase/LRE family protein [Planctomycetales bacterium]|nr:SMP-30/gluconolactonase/LRE family protein [Planctomycetales bacterium]
MSLSLFCVGMSSNLPLAMAQQTLGSIERTTPAMDQLVAKDAKIEVLGNGFTWTEGPVWVGDRDGYLLFSDIPRNTIFKWQTDGTISLFMSPSGYTGVTYYGAEPGSNGLLLDPRGRLLMCEHGDRRLSVLTDKGGKRTLVDNYQGKRLNSPNDAVLKSNGDIYFTDPPYGLPDREDDPSRELDFCGVFRLSPSGSLTLLTKEINRPNGIAFSPDEKTLYVAQSDPAQANWTSFAVKEDGTLAAGKEINNVTDRVANEPGLPDGLAVDRQGILWASGPGGIYVMGADGKLLGRLVTGMPTSNCCFGPDGYLYMTVDSYLCRVKTLTSGVAFQDK